MRMLLNFMMTSIQIWEDRFLLLGLSKDLKLLLVCHCFKELESLIRIISARKATKKESKHYTGES
jgi:uncharacterized DUF497 family protein